MAAYILVFFCFGIFNCLFQTAKITEQNEEKRKANKSDAEDEDDHDQHDSKEQRLTLMEEVFSNLSI